MNTDKLVELERKWRAEAADLMRQAREAHYLTALPDKAEDITRRADELAAALRAEQAVGTAPQSERVVVVPMNDDLRDILGRACFQFIGIAKLMRAAGMEVKTRAEDEQAYGIHWLLTLYAKHGAGWREAGDAQLREWQALLAAAPGGEGEG